MERQWEVACARPEMFASFLRRGSLVILMLVILVACTAASITMVMIMIPVGEL